MFEIQSNISIISHVSKDSNHIGWKKWHEITQVRCLSHSYLSQSFSFTIFFSPSNLQVIYSYFSHTHSWTLFLSLSLSIFQHSFPLFFIIFKNVTMLNENGWWTGNTEQPNIKWKKKKFKLCLCRPSNNIPTRKHP